MSNAILKSTGQAVQFLPQGKTTTVKVGYEEVIIPLSPQEKRNAKPGTVCHVQIVRKNKITKNLSQ